MGDALILAVYSLISFTVDEISKSNCPYLPFINNQLLLVIIISGIIENFLSASASLLFSLVILQPLNQ